jgi:copper homeostasis protein
LAGCPWSGTAKKTANRIEVRVIGGLQLAVPVYPIRRPKSKGQGAPLPNRVLIEISVASVDDSIAAVAGGADRLELNCALPLGGLTPSTGLFAEVRRRVSVPVIVMVRPRPGGFAYSDADFEVMLQDARSFIASGADGLAFGVLKPDGTIDVGRCRQVRDVCGGHEAVFHRAFDVTPDPGVALEILIDLGFTRFMTSGQAESALAGADAIAELRCRGTGRIEVLPAGGISPHTVADLVSRTGCDQVHASVRTSSSDPSVVARPWVRFGRRELLPEDRFDHTDVKAVAALRSALSSG